MDWKQAMEQERVALMRLVALLHALAGLAERAAGRSPAVRGFVVWLLRHAETVTRDFAGDTPDMPSMPLAPAGYQPEDAMRLALNLQALAWQLEQQAMLLVAACGDSKKSETLHLGRMRAARDCLHALTAFVALSCHAPHLALPDTS